MSVINNIEPKQVFRFFEEICAIPHGSSDTKQISDYLVQFADERGLRVIQDKLGNVIIFKDGTAGYEDAAPVMLQGHMDMVCEKDKSSDIDFSRDGLKLMVEGNVISAEGTTLGGDDGIAVAFALAILDSKDNEIPHPPLEVIITVDEEIGMLGAAALDCSVLKSAIMLNLDSEDEGKLLVSCAGGVTSVCHIPVEYSDSRSGGEIKAISVSGIAGGHSGVEIDRQGANANKVLGRLLYRIKQEMDISLVSINGGLKDNAIPREASALVLFQKKDDEILKRIVSELNSVLKCEYATTDPEINICIADYAADNIKDGKSVRYMTEASTDRVIAALNLIPNGIQRMSKDIEGLVQTSLNLGILKTVEDSNSEVLLSFSVRSSVGSEKDELTDRLKCLSEAFGGYCTSYGGYPAWEYRKESPLRELMTNIYREMFGKVPEIQAIHAGVECGLFAGKIPDLDCVSYGPRIDDIHTPSECLYIDSVQRTWEYTLEILKRLK